ncbi:MAG: putative metallopeptidase [Candidatus Aenigmarchaeota archaeon]|nr:putative metallopeptidase [Candidatus Aenigmarchaeota archaeon]
MNYDRAPDLDERIFDIVQKLKMEHVQLPRVVCIRSRGSKSRRTLARCHVLPKIIQEALGIKAYYIIEAISENFDSLQKEEQTKILIHELMHIPKTFGGGFKFHNYVNRREVEKMYRMYKG